MTEPEKTETSGGGIWAAGLLTLLLSGMVNAAWVLWCWHDRTHSWSSDEMHAPFATDHASAILFALWRTLSTVVCVCVLYRPTRRWMRTW